MSKSKSKSKVKLPKYTSEHGWQGGDSRTLYAFVDLRSFKTTVRPGGNGGFYMKGVGPESSVRVASRNEATSEWQDPLHAGWKTEG